ARPCARPHRRLPPRDGATRNRADRRARAPLRPATNPPAARCARACAPAIPPRPARARPPDRPRPWRRWPAHVASRNPDPPSQEVLRRAGHEIPQKTRPGVRGALPRVDDRGAGKVGRAMRLRDAAAEIDVFEVEEVPLVESTQILQEPRAGEHERAADERYVADAVVADVAHLVMVETPLKPPLHEPRRESAQKEVPERRQPL